MFYRNSNLENLFDEFFNSPTYTKSKESNQMINYTKDGAYLTMEVPGFNKTNLKVEVEDGVLYIQGKRVVKTTNGDLEKVINSSFRIGKEYNDESLEATIEDGILTVYVPNLKKPEKKKRISLL